MSEEEQILMEVLQCRRVDLYLERKGLNREQKAQFEAMQRRRIAGEPLQYIIGHVDFMGYKLFVDQRVLIPRPETEIMVNCAVELLHQMYSGQTLRVLDLGTGSGNIAIAIARNFPDCELTALDASKEALELARRNARFQNVFSRIEFVHQPMASFLQRSFKPEEKFDLVISNPPYIPSEKIRSLPKDVLHEPRMALEGGKDGFEFIRQLMPLSPNALHENGKLVFEIWDGQSETVYAMYDYFKHFRQIEFGKDYTDTNRYVICRLRATDPTVLEKFGKAGHHN